MNIRDRPAKISWIFDVISPFAYLSLKQLPHLPSQVEVHYVPVLLAGLLDHHGQIGPAEMSSKRRFTYRFALWRARRMGIKMKLPPLTRSIHCKRCVSLSPQGVVNAHSMTQT